MKKGILTMAALAGLGLLPVAASAGTRFSWGFGVGFGAYAPPVAVYSAPVYATPAVVSGGYCAPAASYYYGGPTYYPGYYYGGYGYGPVVYPAFGFGFGGYYGHGYHYGGWGGHYGGWGYGGGHYGGGGWGGAHYGGGFGHR